MEIVGLLLLTALAAEEPVNVDRPQPRLRVALAFDRALAGKISTRRRDAPLRKTLRDISEATKIAILLDRRIDPGHKTTITLNRVSVLESVEAIAKTASADVAVLGNTVYVGPPQAVEQLDDLLKQRSAELRRVLRGLPRRKRLTLTRRRTLHWSDLARPRDLVKEFAGEYKLPVAGLDKIPHDLWAGSTLPSVSVSQGLSLLLIQFDLTFRWKPAATGIELVPIPKPAKNN